MKAYVKDTQDTDLEFLGENLRDEDIREIYAHSGLEPHVALEYTFGLSRHCKTIFGPTGEPIGIYGTNDTSTEGLGAIWMMATPSFLQHQRQFIRECREGILEISRGYSCVFNCTDARNTVHHRWLKWCGFTFIKEHENYGKNGEPFYEFVKII